MTRDDEIQRLVNYIKGLGLKITFSSQKKDYSAEWYLDNTGIVIYKNHNSTKIQTVLSLIHEIGHALHNIHEKERRLDPKYEKAIDHVSEAETQEIDAPKKQRKIVLDNEVAGTKYWNSIYKETNMKFPIWRLEMAMEYDIWQYQVLFETGKDPDHKERNKKNKELVKKYRRKYDE